jgi:3D (Asp-Asp-Asp) domain-containing protein
LLALVCGTGQAQEKRRPTPRTMTMEVTAYCPCKKCCGKHARGITASGLKVTHNRGLFVAADTVLPFHTKLIIPGYASDHAVPVLDRGGAIKGNRIDVFFPTHEQARQWGRRTVEVTILENENAAQ